MEPFDGLFGSRAYHFAGGFRWDFRAPDLNDSARAMFGRLDRVFEILATPAWMFLSTIELDAEAGRFPEVLSQYFQDETWDYTDSFFVASMLQTPTQGYCPVGRFTFEAEPGLTRRVLAQNDGFRWGSALKVWGIQVERERVPDVIALSPDKPNELMALAEVARAAWLASDDLDALALWVSPTIDQRLRELLASFPRQNDSNE